MSKYSRDKIRSQNKVAGDSPVDPDTGHIIILPYEQHEVNRGNMWAFSHLADEVAKDAFLYVQINTGALAVHLHSVRMWTNAPKARVDLFVGISELVDGDAELALKQVNQTVEVEPPEGLALFTNPTEIAVDPDHSQFFGGGGGGSGAATNADKLAFETPLTMKPNTKNVICVKNEGAIIRSISINGLLHIEDR